MQETSLLRTYRYLRLSIAGTVAVIAVSVILATSDVGVLGSISAYYYSPARNAIVGALIAASLGMLALSGRGAERALLDVAALLAPLIALVPTPVGPGQVDGLNVTCAEAAVCIPGQLLPEVDNGVATYLIVGALAVLAAVGVGVAGSARPAQPGRTTLAVIWPSVAGAALTLLIVWSTWTFARDAFLSLAHIVAAIGFFAILALVSLLSALRPEAASGMRPQRWARIAYGVIAVAIIVDLLIVIVFVALGGTRASDPPGPPVLLVGEFLALLLFAAFWLLQTTHTWEASNPSLRSKDDLANLP